jgi:hypothetical protein
MDLLTPRERVIFTLGVAEQGAWPHLPTFLGTWKSWAMSSMGQECAYLFIIGLALSMGLGEYCQVKVYAGE